MKLLLNMVANFLIEQSWQISMVFGLVLVASWLLRNASAHWRYLLWLVVIAKCLIPPIVTVPLPLLPAEKGTIPLTTVTDVPSPINNSDFDSKTEIARSSMPVAQAAESVGTEDVPSSIVREPIPLPYATYNLREWLVTAWLLIVGILMIHVTGRMWSTHRRLKRTCQPADAETQAAVVALAQMLGMKKTPAVHMADSFAQPFVWGRLRGDVYLPKTFPETGTVEQRRAVLMHELAHVLRWDAAVNHLQNVVQAVFFFHPLIWWTNQKIRQEREKCCDEIVLSASGTQPRVYCEAIVEMLAQEYTSRQSTPALAVTGSLGNTKERITTMLTPNRRFLRRPSRAAFITVMLVAACVLPTALVMTPQIGNAAAQDETAKPDAVADSKDTRPAKISTWAKGQTMDFRVINADTMEPIPDVTLELQNMGPGIDSEDVKTLKTDATGWARIPLPDLPPMTVHVFLVKDGFSSLSVAWRATPHPTIPASITIPMEPGQAFGGTIRNEMGKPIPDVKVTVKYWGEGKGESPHVGAFVNATTTTNDSGEWRLNNMPAEFDNENDLRIYLHHPDYASDPLQLSSGPRAVTERPGLTQLLNQSAVMTMIAGGTIEGRVVNEEGKPIPNAAIYDVEYYGASPGIPRASTDKNGKFRITGVTYSEGARFEPDGVGLILTVHATGYAPEMISVAPNASALDVELRHGKSVRGRIVDEGGKPIEGVQVVARRWHDWTRRLHLETKSDLDGKFLLKDAPADGVAYDIIKGGYLLIEEFPMSPSSNDHTVTLKASVRIVGSVVDAETGEPLKRFVLIRGAKSDDAADIHWHRIHGGPYFITDGSYETEIMQKDLDWRLRIEADGYMPAISRIFRPYDPDKGEITYDFKLTKAAPLTGTVLGLDDKPLANADVYLATQRMNIANRKVTSTEVPPVKTDVAGRFQFPPEVEPFCIVVVHEHGIGMITEAECKTPPTITIKPWGSVKDQLQIIRKPAGMHSDFP